MLECTTGAAVEQHDEACCLSYTKPIDQRIPTLLNQPQFRLRHGFYSLGYVSASALCA